MAAIEAAIERGDAVAHELFSGILSAKAHVFRAEKALSRLQAKQGARRRELERQKLFLQAERLGLREVRHG